MSIVFIVCSLLNCTTNHGHQTTLDMNALYQLAENTKFDLFYIPKTQTISIIVASLQFHQQGHLDLHLASTALVCPT